MWLQEFAWTERKQCEMLATRNASSTSDKTIAAEPMFCFETAMKAFYWSGLVYDTAEACPMHIQRIRPSQLFSEYGHLCASEQPLC